MPSNVPEHAVPEHAGEDTPSKRRADPGGGRGDGDGGALFSADPAGSADPGASADRAAHVEPAEFRVLGFHEYLPTAEEIVSARHFVHETLAGRGVGEDVIAAAELVVDEFSLNAMRHAGSFFSVSVEEAPGAVRIAVRDDSNVFPVVQEHVVLSISGRGLSIVASTAEQWGAQSLGRGKEVWAVLR